MDAAVFRIKTFSVLLQARKGHPNIFSPLSEVLDSIKIMLCYLGQLITHSYGGLFRTGTGD